MKKPPHRKGGFFRPLPLRSTKVEVSDVVVEGDAFGAAVSGQYVQDVALLAGGEHALTVMDTIVGTLAAAQIGVYILARC